MNKKIFILAVLIIILLLFPGGVLNFAFPKTQPKPLNIQEIPISAGVVPSDLISYEVICLMLLTLLISREIIY